MNIDSIKNGIVIDHITAGKGIELYQLLNLDTIDCSVAFIKNVNSKKMGKKDIIKIDGDIDINMDILGYVDPNVTVDIIKEGKLVEIDEFITAMGEKIGIGDDVSLAMAMKTGISLRGYRR